ncbi:MAG: ribosome biogenesis GTP-binding protein YihA/YsxC [Gammaproteobacteria bacterium]|nr:ribosome biogenesis GTP-binding protein YihA/YsxC [Gammaproteobacteria bacterium]
MDLSQTQFTISAAKVEDCPLDSHSEVAFAGRSNAGKSSAINALTRQSKLARISKTPGRTRLINFFQVAENCYLVDLPGYGFAQVPLAVKEKWQTELERYLRQRQALSGIVLLSDVRHPLKDFDRMMVNWAVQSELPVLLLLTKADKLKRGAAQTAMLQVRKTLAECPGVQVQLFSALRQLGLETARQVINNWLVSDHSSERQTLRKP